MAPILHIAGADLPSYTLMLLAGFAAGLILAELRARQYGLRPDAVLAAYFLAGVGAFLGGKLFYVAQGWSRYLEAAVQGLSFFDFFSSAGLVFYGGMAGTIAFIFLAAALLKLPPWTVMDALLPSLPLAQAFGRVGCLLAGCCYGLPVSWGLYMQPGSGAPTEEALLPVQLFESAGTLLICLMLLRLSRKRPAPGAILGSYLISYACLRFLLEFLRYDAVRGSWGGLSVGQWCSIAAGSAGAVLLWYSCRQASRKTAQIAAVESSFRPPQ